MISNETDLKDDVRQLTGYTSTNVLSTDGLDTSYRTAKRHIRIEKSFDSDYDWFGDDKPESVDALFWFTCLFTKIQTGELDSQDLQIGAIDQKTLLAKGDGEVTTWFRNANSALRALNSDNLFTSASPQRSNRNYEADSYTRESGDSGSTVDSSDI